MRKGVYKQQTHSTHKEPNLMRECEIIYVKSKSDGTVGWKWRLVEDKSRASEETYELFYECVTAARAKGLQPNVKCL